MPQAGRLRYFAACNSENGFHSFYPRVFSEELFHVYIIKGGPGTGKSSLMRRAADRAEEKGYRVEEIYCSSDPTSLDGVIVYDAAGRGIAVLDGTAPHVREAELAGARDELLYVGDFWNSEKLAKMRDQIEALSRARSESFRCLYRYLHAAGQCTQNMEAALSGGVDTRKMRETVASILLKCPIGTGFEEKIMVTRSIGMSGAVRFPTLENGADAVYQLRDCAGIAYRMLEEIYAQAKKRHMPVWLSYDPLLPSRLDGIYLPETRQAFVLRTDDAVLGEIGEETPMRRISLRQYVSADLLARSTVALTRASKNRDRLMAAAYEVLSEIRTTHFTLEQIYKDAMDFAALDARIAQWLEKIMP